MKIETLYHGSTSIGRHPQAGKWRKGLDFGPGFYLTPMRGQARQWAIRVKTIRATMNSVVNKYKLVRLDRHRIRRFDAYDEDWLGFLVQSRMGQKPWAGYDIVEGDVADDRVIDSIEAYVNGYSTLELTLSKLSFHKPNWQVCILNRDVIDDCLTYVGHMKV